jgi:Ca2+-binding EF-hand superfamily protein
MTDWGSVDTTLDEIISLAASLKGSVGGVKGFVDAALAEKERNVTKVHADLEDLQTRLDHTSLSHTQERAALEAQIAAKEVAQKAQLDEYDLKVQATLDEKERAEREREAARGDAAQEKARLAGLLKDLEEDASTYSRLRPSKPILAGEDVNILRQLFLSSAVSGSGKVSFADLKQIIHKYDTVLPEGPLKKLFVMVENDQKGRMSYITLVAVANDLAALVGDFRKIDLNGNGTLSRKEFREHFHALGFQKNSVVDALFRYADEDESDEVGFAEYVHLAVCLLVLRILYSFADGDKSGVLSKDEVKKVLDEAHIPDQARNKFDHQYSVVDTDDNKILSYQEFVMLVLLMFVDD